MKRFFKDSLSSTTGLIKNYKKKRRERKETITTTTTTTTTTIVILIFVFYRQKEEMIKFLETLYLTLKKEKIVYSQFYLYYFIVLFQVYYYVIYFLKREAFVPRIESKITVNRKKNRKEWN